MCVPAAGWNEPGVSLGVSRASRLLARCRPRRAPPRRLRQLDPRALVAFSHYVAVLNLWQTSPPTTHSTLPIAPIIVLMAIFPGALGYGTSRGVVGDGIKDVLAFHCDIVFTAPPAAWKAYGADVQEYLTKQSCGRDSSAGASAGD